MLTIEDLTDSLGLSEYQVRRRINALDGIIDDHIKRGKKSKILVDPSGLDLLRELEDLRKSGLTIDEAVEQIKKETGKDVSEKVEDFSTNQRKVRGQSELVEELRNRVESLEEDKRELRAQLEKKDQRIDQLLPGKVEHKGPLSRFWEWLGL